ATKLMIKYLGPFRIVQQVTPVVYEIRDLYSGQKRTVHVQRLRTFSPWKLSHVESIDTPPGDVPLETYDFQPTDFTGRRPQQRHDQEHQPLPVQHQKIEVYVD